MQKNTNKQNTSKMKELMQKKLTQKELRKNLNYNPTTGIFTWAVNKANGTHIGDIAGYINCSGYHLIKVNYNLYPTHRLAWLYVYGYFPEHDIDHRNGIRNDNRLSNLREVSRSCNLQNCKIFSTNTTGFPGVHWSKRDNNWRVRIEINQKKYHLGNYDDPLDAALARLTEEVWNPNWHCNHRGELIKAIKRAWPNFNEKSLS